MAPDRAVLESAQVREALADVRALTPQLLATVAPLLGLLRSGHYAVTLVDLDTEAVDRPEQSWWSRRVQLRDGWEDDHEAPGWPGENHLQVREPLPGEIPTFCVVMPTQPPERTDPNVVDRHAAAMRDGRHPAAVLLTLIEDRYVECLDEERLVIGVVLDGHHRLLAAAREGLPARAVMVTRLEDVAAEDPACHVDKVLAPLRSS